MHSIVYTWAVVVCLFFRIDVICGVLMATEVVFGRLIALWASLEGEDLMRRSGLRDFPAALCVRSLTLLFGLESD